jgi:hypothetical protein
MNTIKNLIIISTAILVLAVASAVVKVVTVVKDKKPKTEKTK